LILALRSSALDRYAAGSPQIEFSRSAFGQKLPVALVAHCDTLVDTYVYVMNALLGAKAECEGVLME
jgi:hypothetical protein